MSKTLDLLYAEYKDRDSQARFFNYDETVPYVQVVLKEREEFYQKYQTEKQQILDSVDRFRSENEVSIEENQKFNDWFNSLLM